MTTTETSDLRHLPGEWFVVKTKIGGEQVAKRNIFQRVKKFQLEDLIYQIEVPKSQVSELKSGRMHRKTKNALPGYILVRMEFNDETWALVGQTPGVTGVIGAVSKPTPISVDEVEKLMETDRKAVEQQKLEPVISSSAGVRQFFPGESVTITDGPFAALPATIEDVDTARKKLNILVSLFGRDTKVEIEMDKVK